MKQIFCYVFQKNSCFDFWLSLMMKQETTENEKKNPKLQDKEVNLNVDRWTDIINPSWARIALQPGQKFLDDEIKRFVKTNQSIHFSGLGDNSNWATYSQQIQH